MNMCRIVTPLKQDRWEEQLAEHPDRTIADYILRVIRQGFRIGFDPRVSRLRARPMNLPSADEHPEVLPEYLKEELAQGRVVRLDNDREELLRVHVSTLASFPRK